MKLPKIRTKLVSKLRSITQGIDAVQDGDYDLRHNEQRELLVVDGSGLYSEIIRTGRGYCAIGEFGGHTVDAIPTTAYLLTIYNGENDGNLSYIIDWVAASNSSSADGVKGQAQLLGLVGQVREPFIQAGNKGKVIQLNGTNTIDNLISLPKTTKVNVDENASGLSLKTGIKTNWFPIGPSIVNFTLVLDNSGYGLWAAVNGRIIVPPGRYFAMHVLTNSINEQIIGFIAWHEKQITLG